MSGFGSGGFQEEDKAKLTEKGSLDDFLWKKESAANPLPHPEVLIPPVVIPKLVEIQGIGEEGDIQLYLPDNMLLLLARGDSFPTMEFKPPEMIICVRSIRNYLPQDCRRGYAIEGAKENLNKLRFLALQDTIPEGMTENQWGLAKKKMLGVLSQVQMGAPGRFTTDIFGEHGVELLEQLPPDQRFMFAANVVRNLVYEVFLEEHKRVSKYYQMSTVYSMILYRYGFMTGLPQTPEELISSLGIVYYRSRTTQQSLELKISRTLASFRNASKSMVGGHRSDLLSRT